MSNRDISAALRKTSPVFADAPYYGGTTCETLFDRGLCLPSGSGLKEEELRYVADKIKEFFNK